MKLYYKDETAEQAAARCSWYKTRGYCATKWTWTDKYGNKARLGSFWCAATCGVCAGPEASWTTGTFANKQLSVGGVGVYVWKTNAAFTEYILPSLELHVGAHYYAAAPYTTNYNSAMAYMTLPSVDEVLLSSSKRVACMAINARGSKYCGVDFSVENEGSGWFAMFYGSCNGIFQKGNRSPHPAATQVSISVDATVDSTQDAVVASFNFLNADGDVVGSDTLSFTEDKGTFFPNTVTAESRMEYPMVRWTRFMSLLHSGGVDYAMGDKADGTYMTNAQFDSLQLYDWAAEQYTPWGSSNVEHAWHVETGNVQELSITPTSTSTTDTFSCMQQVQYI